MKIRYALAVSAVALATAPLAAPASATCGPVVIEVCRVVCRIPNDVVFRLCTVT